MSKIARVVLKSVIGMLNIGLQFLANLSKFLNKEMVRISPNVLGIGDDANWKCHQRLDEILILFYSHYIREISKVVFKKLCHPIESIHFTHAWLQTKEVIPVVFPIQSI